MTVEQLACELLARLGVDEAQSYTAGDLVELATLIAERDALQAENALLKRALALLARDHPFAPASLRDPV